MTSFPQSIHGQRVAGSMVPLCATIEATLAHMDREAALVVDDDGRLRGLVTDGDLRRAFLRGAELSAPVCDIMTSHPFSLPMGTPPEQIRREMVARGIRHLPILDKDDRPVALHLLKDYLGELDAAGAVVMAGGQGTRLRPLTLDTPKPLLRIGDRPILDTILEGLRNHGVQDVMLTVNYLGEQIKQHVGDGQSYGMRIGYVEEEQQMGTAGALALLEPRPVAAFIIMNGDLFTELDYRSFVRFHRTDGNDLTMCVRRHISQIPYGVVTLSAENDQVCSLVEKPEQQHLVNAGIYMVEPHVVDLVPKGEPFDMVRLVHACLANGLRVGAFPILEYWCDIGQHQDMQAARAHWREQATRAVNLAAADSAAHTVLQEA